MPINTDLTVKGIGATTSGTAASSSHSTAPDENGAAVKMNSAPGTDAASSPRNVGPGSRAYMTELAELTRAVESHAGDLDSRIRSFFTKHDVRGFLSRLVEASCLDPAKTAGMFTSRAELGVSAGQYRVYGSTSTPYDMVKYQEKLSKLLPEVEAGKLSLETARKRAAFPFGLSFLTFGTQHAMEIANLHEKRGVLVSLCPGYPEKTDHERTAVVSLSNYRPDTWTTFRHSWRDLETRIVLDKEMKVIVVDQRTPEKSYDTLVRLLRYVGDLGRLEVTNARQ